MIIAPTQFLQGGRTKSWPLEETRWFLGDGYIFFRMSRHRWMLALQWVWPVLWDLLLWKSRMAQEGQSRTMTFLSTKAKETESTWKKRRGDPLPVILWTHMRNACFLGEAVSKCPFQSYDWAVVSLNSLGGKFSVLCQGVLYMLHGTHSVLRAFTALPAFPACLLRVSQTA